MVDFEKMEALELLESLFLFFPGFDRYLLRSIHLFHEVNAFAGGRNSLDIDPEGYRS